MLWCLTIRCHDSEILQSRMERTAKYDCSASAFSSVSMMLLRAPLLLGAAWEAAASAADALHCKLLLSVACCRVTPPIPSILCCHILGKAAACKNNIHHSISGQHGMLRILILR